MIRGVLSHGGWLEFQPQNQEPSRLPCKMFGSSMEEIDI